MLWKYDIIYDVKSMLNEGIGYEENFKKFEINSV